MQQLTDLYNTILTTGTDKTDRTGVGTRSIFGHQMRFDLSKGFPLATRKFVPFKLVASELLWFLKGQQDRPGAIEDLHADKNHIWDEWVKEDGSFGPIYGVQWRRWLGKRDVELDQIAELIKTLRTNPDSRRMIVTAWQPAEIAGMALPPCHVMFQLNARPLPDGRRAVDLQMYQRSCDAFLGVPFNIASYSLLLHMIVQVAGPQYVVGDFVWTGGDVHIYQNHMEAVAQYLKNPEHPLPTLRVADHVDDIDGFKLSDFVVENYQHSGKIAAEVAV